MQKPTTELKSLFKKLGPGCNHSLLHEYFNLKMINYSNYTSNLRGISK